VVVGRGSNRTAARRLPLRVLFVCAYYWPAEEWGGPVRSVRLLAQSLRQAGVGVEVATTSGRGKRELTCAPAGWGSVDGIRVRYEGVLGPRRYFWSPALTWHLACRVREVDVVHVHGLWVYPTLAASRLAQWVHVPYVLSPRGALDAWGLEQKRWKKRLYLWLVESRTLSRSAAVHFTSDGEQSEAWKVGPFRRGVVVPNAVDCSVAMAPVREEPDASGLRLLMLGRIHPVKGLDLAIEALGDLSRSGYRFQLRVAGADESGYRAVAERLATLKGLAEQVRFVGPLDRASVAAALAWCDVLLMPSRQESFGMAAAEAMAAGRPVVVSDRVGIARDIARAHAGLVVSLEQGELARALVEIGRYGRTRREMGLAGRRFVEANYSPRVVATRMLGLYEDAAAKCRRERGKPCVESPA